MFISTHSLVGLVLAALLVASCKDTTTNTESPNGFTVSGIITNSDGTPPASLPASARVMLVWDARDSLGDIGIVGEEGTIDRTNRSFSISMPSVPPNDELYAPRDGHLFGVGFIVLTTDSSVHRGTRTKDFGSVPSPILGGADNNAIAYHQGDYSQSVDSTFPQGYSLAQTIRQGSKDWFKALPNQPVILRLDTGRNLRFANWH